MSIDPIIWIATPIAVVTVIGAVFARIASRRLTDVSVGGSVTLAEEIARAVSRPTDEQRPDTLEDRLGHLSELMGQSRVLVEQVSAELDARAATARELQEEVKQAEALAAMNREQADAIRRLIDAELEVNRKYYGSRVDGQAR